MSAGCADPISAQEGLGKEELLTQLAAVFGVDTATIDDPCRLSDGSRHSFPQPLSDVLVDLLSLSDRGDFSRADSPYWFI